MARKNHTVKEIAHHFPTVKIEQDIAHQSRIFCFQNQIGGTDSHARGIDVHTHFIDSQPRAFLGHKTVNPAGHIVLVDPHIAHPGIYVGPFLMLDIHTSVVAWARPDFAVAVKVVTVRNVVHYQVVDQDLEFHRLARFFLGCVGRGKIIDNKVQIQSRRVYANVIVRILQAHLAERQAVLVEGEPLEPERHRVGNTYRVVVGIDKFHVPQHQVVERVAAERAYFHLAAPLFAEVAADRRSGQRLNQRVVQKSDNNVNDDEKRHHNFACYFPKTFDSLIL